MNGKISLIGGVIVLGAALTLKWYLASAQTKWLMGTPTISPDAPRVGDSVTISLPAQNTGTTTETKTISLTGDVVASQVVTLNPNEQKTIQFSFAATKSGAYILCRA